MNILRILLREWSPDSQVIRRALLKNQARFLRIFHFSRSFDSKLTKIFITGPFFHPETLLGSSKTPPFGVFLYYWRSGLSAEKRKSVKFSARSGFVSSKWFDVKISKSSENEQNFFMLIKIFWTMNKIFFMSIKIFLKNEQNFFHVDQNFLKNEQNFFHVDQKWPDLLLKPSDQRRPWRS